MKASTKNCSLVESPKRHGIYSDKGILKMSLQWVRQTETVPAGDRDDSFPIPQFGVAPNFQTLISPYDG